jgi:hypothetical protein
VSEGDVRTLTTKRGVPADAPGSPQDGGFSLVEQVVALGVLTVLFVIFMAAVVQMTGLTVRVQKSGAALDEVSRGVSRFDRQLRSADAVDRPGKVGTDWYLEFRTGANGSSASACTQWRLHSATAQLQFRTWADVSSPTVSSWQTVASGVVNDPTTEPPFVFSAATTSQSQQRVDLYLVAGSAPLRMITTLAARNTSTITVTNPDTDGDGVTDSPVCQQAGRP